MEQIGLEEKRRLCGSSLFLLTYQALLSSVSIPFLIGSFLIGGVAAFLQDNERLSTTQGFQRHSLTIGKNHCEVVTGVSADCLFLLNVSEEPCACADLVGRGRKVYLRMAANRRLRLLQSFRGVF